MKLYALKDVKSGQFGPVMLAHNDAHMTRSMVEVFKGSRETVAKFPQDFELYEVGEYNLDTGHIVSSPRFVCSAALALDESSAEG